MMDKAQAVHDFWSSFGLPAYDESTLPQGDEYDHRIQPPYITYTFSEAALDTVVYLSASVWYRSTSWGDISRKVDEIARRLGERGFYIAPLDNGYLWLTQGTPFAQRLSDPNDDMIRRIVLNVNAEFLTSY